MILVFGSTGQVARELKALAPDARFLSRAEADLTNPQICAEAISAARPKAVINAAAYTAVDRAEENEATAMLVNGNAPGAMAEACAILDIPFVHISTDYVFDGKGLTPFSVGDPIAPLGAYGRSKALGEKKVCESGASHAVLRTSWVFSRYGNNFVKTMLRLAETRKSLSIVADQVGGPTPAVAIAEACLDIATKLAIEPQLAGRYHLAGLPEVSWAEFAREIFRQAGLAVSVEGIPSSDYPTPAKRPLNSRLDCSGLTRFGINRPDWRAALSDVINSMETA